MFGTRPALWPLLLAFAGSVLTGCESAQVVPVPPGPECEKVTIEAVLHVNGRDPRVTWGTELASERPINVRPRPDLGWTVDPAAPERLLDRQGELATFEGEIFRQACFLRIADTFFVGPEDLPDPDRPPN